MASKYPDARPPMSDDEEDWLYDDFYYGQDPTLSDPDSWWRGPNLEEMQGDGEWEMSREASRYYQCLAEENQRRLDEEEEDDILHGISLLFERAYDDIYKDEAISFVQCLFY